MSACFEYSPSGLYVPYELAIGAIVIWRCRDITCAMPGYHFHVQVFNQLRQIEPLGTYPTIWQAYAIGQARSAEILGSDT
jgi:hypothetical protein